MEGPQDLRVSGLLLTDSGVDVGIELFLRLERCQGEGQRY
jgi:hypothetical protein